MGKPHQPGRFLCNQQFFTVAAIRLSVHLPKKTPHARHAFFAKCLGGHVQLLQCPNCRLTVKIPGVKLAMSSVHVQLGYLVFLALSEFLVNQFKNILCCV